MKSRLEIAVSNGTSGGQLGRLAHDARVLRSSRSLIGPLLIDRTWWRHGSTDHRNVKSNGSSDRQWFKIPLQVAWKNSLQNMVNGALNLFLERNEPICVIQANDHASGMTCLRSVRRLSDLYRE